MSFKFRQDYGNKFFDIISFDPYNKKVQFGTNLYYKEIYGKNTAAPFDYTEVKDYLFRTNTSPYFETYIYNQGLKFSYNDPAIKGYQALLYYGGLPSIDFRIQSSSKNFAYTQAADDQTTIGVTYNGYNIDLAVLNNEGSLRIENPTLTKVINLSLRDLINTEGKEVRLREFAICDQGISKKILLFASDFYL